MRECMKNLQDYIKAKIKCVWINTYEEDAVINDIKEIASAIDVIKTNFKVYNHSFVSGTLKEALPLDTDKSPRLPSKRYSTSFLFSTVYEITRGIEHYYMPGERNNLEENEELIIEDPNNIFILKDFHLMLENAQYMRMFRDVVEGDWVNYNLFIVIAPYNKIPIEFEKLFYVIEYDTPDDNYILNFIDTINKSIKNKNNGLEIDGEQKKQLLIATRGLTCKEIEYVYKLSLLRYKTLNVAEINKFKIELIKKSDILDYKICNSSLEDIGGNIAFKEWVKEVIEAFTPEAQEFGCVKPKGYLSLGIPGSAKTIMAEALAGTMNVPLLKLNMSKILDSRVGSSERNMAKAIKMIKAMAPCLLLIDEAEKSLSGIGSSNASDAGTMARAIGAILEFLCEDHGVFVVMTSNNVLGLPPELTRTGRLDAIWYFGLPEESERKEIFKIHFNKVGKQVDEDVLKYAASNSDKFTGAEIQEVVKKAMMKAFRRAKTDGNNEITKEDIKKSCMEVIPISISSEEEIKSLERFAKGRARYANKMLNEHSSDLSKNKEIKSTIVSLSDLKNK